jgi:hypothetical protein
MGLPVALLLAQAGGKGERIFAPVHVALNRKYAHFQANHHKYRIIYQLYFGKYAVFVTKTAEKIQVWLI